jgi:Flp pilus assembly pilin Flp
MSLQAFWRDQRAASAAEFALVVPVLLIFLLGTIDVGRFIWNVNEAEKATQIGTRWAVATDMIPSGLYTYSFATSGGIPQGTLVPQASFPGVECKAPSGTPSCTCKQGGQCGFGTTANPAAFNSLVSRMNEIYGGIGPANVQVDYDWSGLGYAGDPNGSDVDPLVTVRVTNLNFRPIFLGSTFDFGLPDLSYTLTMEDGQGNFSN